MILIFFPTTMMMMMVTSMCTNQKKRNVKSKFVLPLPTPPHTHAQLPPFVYPRSPRIPRKKRFP